MQVMALTAAEAAGVAAVIASVMLFISGKSWRSPGPRWLSVASTLAVGVAFYLGFWALELKARWPPVEIQDRFLYILLPAVVVVELIAALPRVPLWAGWVLRLLVAAAAAPVLLYNSRYISDVGGPDTRRWSPSETLWLLGAFAVGLAALWGLLSLLPAAARTRSVLLALAVACAGSGAACMYSGWATEGQMGLALGAALVGVAAVTYALPALQVGTGPLGVGLVGLFTLSVGGRFFAGLTSLHALLLFGAPLLCVLPDLIWARKLQPLVRGGLRIALVALPIVLVVAQARQEAKAQSRPSEPGEENYEDLYKSFQ
jgi:hypothetical protein